MKNKALPEKPYPKNFPLGPDPIHPTKLEEIRTAQLPDWIVLKSALPENPYEERTELYREYKFVSFEAALQFMASLAKGCEVLMHHPRWENIWCTLRVYTTSWDIGHLISDRDIQLARYFDREYKKFDGAKRAENPLGIGVASNEFIDHLKQDVGENKLKAVGEKLRDFFMLNADNDAVNVSIQLLGQINEVKEKEMLKTIKKEDASLEYSQIRAALLKTIDERLNS